MKKKKILFDSAVSLTMQSFLYQNKSPRNQNSMQKYISMYVCEAQMGKNPKKTEDNKSCNTVHLFKFNPHL